MSLSHYEKKSFFRFITVYLGAVLLVVAGFSLLFYKIETKSIKDSVFNKLRVESFDIASSAIDAQMEGKPFEIPDGVKYSLYDKDKKIIKTNIKTKIKLKNDFFIQDGCAYYVDRGAKGHLGISYILTMDCNYQKTLDKILRHTIMIATFTLLFLIVVGWYLGILFLKPMKEKLKELDTFIKDTTHEINTPITTMLLALQKIEKKGAEQKYLKSLKMSANLISSLYHDISFISLRHKEKTDVKQIDISKHIYKNIEFFSILSEQKKIHIDTKLTPCQVQADSKDIDILIKNLIDNAIKYSKFAGNIKIVLKNCKFSISNEGKTIPKEKLKDIFQRYKRADEVQGGFGIGLDIVQTICKRYGYHLKVISQDGKTEFEVWF